MTSGSPLLLLSLLSTYAHLVLLSASGTGKASAKRRHGGIVEPDMEIIRVKFGPEASHSTSLIIVLIHQFVLISPCFERDQSAIKSQSQALLGEAQVNPQDDGFDDDRSDGLSMRPTWRWRVARSADFFHSPSRRTLFLPSRRLNSLGSELQLC